MRDGPYIAWITDLFGFRGAVLFYNLAQLQTFLRERRIDPTFINEIVKVSYDLTGVDCRGEPPSDDVTGSAT